MFALVAAVLLVLHAFGVLDNTEDVDWFGLALGFWSAHFAVSIPVIPRR